MGLHKLTAGDGYTYLTRQVAVHDSTEKGHAGLGDYYSQKGESPGRWLGAPRPPGPHPGIARGVSRDCCTFR